MRQKKIKIVISLIVALALLAACQDRDLQILAKALDDTAHGVAVLQTVVIEAARQNLITEDAARSILEVSVTVNLAGQDAVTATRNINSLNAADRQKVLAILMPIIRVLENGQTLGNAITDVNVRQKVTTALSVIQASLNSAQLVLATK